MYHFEERIMHYDKYYNVRNMSYAVIISIIERRVACRDRCMDKYVPHGSQTERQRVTSLDLRDTLYLFLSKTLCGDL
uniref:Uncharacterized protein n=1 Tax=Solanum tuberosum TaxID=4113 RepID=M1DGD4_SOLTU